MGRAKTQSDCIGRTHASQFRLDDISLPIPIRLHQYIIKDKPGNKSAKPGAINRRPDFSAGGKATKAEPLSLLLPLQPPATNRILSTSPGLLPNIESGNRDDDFSMDHIAPLPSSAGSKAIFILADRLTKQTHLICAKDTDPIRDLAYQSLHNIFRLHGLPTDLHICLTDGHPQHQIPEHLPPVITMEVQLACQLR